MDEELTPENIGEPFRNLAAVLGSMNLQNRAKVVAMSEYRQLVEQVKMFEMLAESEVSSDEG